MIDQLKSRLLDGIKSPFGNHLPPVRWAKEALLLVNDLAGRPLRPSAQADQSPITVGIAIHTNAPATPTSAREQAPVMLYKDWNSRHDLKRLIDVLVAANIKFQEFDVTDDEATRTWVKATSKVEDLPAVYIAGEAIGGYQELAQIDVSGELRRKVFGN
jgi:glutaredoxin-related protein